MKNKQYKPKNEIPDLSECILIDLEYKYPFIYNDKIYRSKNDCDDFSPLGQCRECRLHKCA